MIFYDAGDEGETRKRDFCVNCKRRKTEFGIYRIKYSADNIIYTGDLLAVWPLSFP